MMKKHNNIAGLSSDEMHRIWFVFDGEPGISEVILYGSRAKGTHRPGSDLDLTLKGDVLTTNQLMDISGRIDDLLLPYEVDLSIFKHIDNPDLIDHINRVGKVVFSNE
jgi:predicted nucleotidyltransferase